MDIEFTWNRAKAKRNLQKHGVSFETAKQAFFDPHLIIVEDCEVDGEMRYHAIGYAGSDLLLVVACGSLRRGSGNHSHRFSAKGECL